MPGLMRQIGLGLAISVCLGAIAACQPSAPPAEETGEVTPSAPAETAPETNTTTPQPPPAAPQTADSEAAPAKPVPPLPAECSAPQTQADMNRCAQAEYDQVDTQLNNAYQQVKASVGAAKAEQLITAEQAWLTYRDAYCDFVQTQFAGGSIQPTVYYGCLTQLTGDRTAELQKQLTASMGYDAADQALNEVYQSLQSYLTPAEQEQLTDAQLAWIAYRDAHCAFEDGNPNACLAQVTETRTQQLREQLDSRSL
ncbi:MAG TPA: lysozyme inhibitor LprI family protein [Candidatus Obscuribacterales bacterium]